MDFDENFDIFEDFTENIDKYFDENFDMELNENFDMMIENMFQDLCQEDHPVPIMSTETAEDLILSPGSEFFNQLEDDPICSQPKKKTRHLLWIYQDYLYIHNFINI